MRQRPRRPGPSALPGERFELRVLAQEGELEVADRAVPLLRDDQTSRSADFMSSVCRKMTTSASCSIEPLSRRSARAGRLPSVSRRTCERATTGMASSRARRLEAARDLGDLLVPGQVAVLGVDEREVVDEDDLHVLVALHPPGLRPQVQQLQVGRVVDEQRRLVDAAAGLGDPAEVGGLQHARAQQLRVDARLHREQALHDRHARHLEGEQAHGDLLADRDVGGHREGEGGLADRRPGADHDELGGLEAVGEVVELGEARGHARVAALGVVEALDRVEGPADDLLGRVVAAALVPVGDLEDLPLGLLDDLADLRGVVVRPGDDLLRDAREAAPDGGRLHDARVVLHVGARRHRRGEARDVGEAAALLQAARASAARRRA